MKILLLDIDGVLIKPGGYRRAVKETIRYFSQQMGYHQISPEEEDIAFCESLGITNEWDIIPLCLASIIEQVLEQEPDTCLSESWEDAVKVLAALPFRLKKVDYLERIEMVSLCLQAGKSPSLSILEFGPDSKGNQPFPLLSNQPLFRSLFQWNKDIAKSMTTNHFQNLVLGRDVFGQTYGLEPRIDSPSYLKQFDTPLLSKESSIRILEQIKRGHLSPVAYSARPSLPPRQVPVQSNSYSPEAEMAMDLVGLADIPLIAYGRLMYSAQIFQVSTDWLIKPSPYQALAAILAAISLDEWKSLRLAMRLGFQTGIFPVEGKNQGKVPDLVDWMQSLKNERLDINIIEDSPIGLTSGKKAGDILSNLGYPVEVSLWGVADQSIKYKALEACGARVFDAVDPIVELILGTNE